MGWRSMCRSPSELYSPPHGSSVLHVLRHRSVSDRQSLRFDLRSDAHARMAAPLHRRQSDDHRACRQGRPLQAHVSARRQPPRVRHRDHRFSGAAHVRLGRDLPSRGVEDVFRLELRGGIDEGHVEARVGADRIPLLAQRAVLPAPQLAPDVRWADQQFEKGVREITSFHRARGIDCNPYRAIKINQSVARERRYHWPHRAERRSVESKSEITGLILLYKAESIHPSYAGYTQPL